MAWLAAAALFITLCYGGLCCNSGWYQYQGKCYMASQRMFENNLAHRYCEIAKAGLAQVTSTELLRFFSTMPNFNGINEYWVKQDSSLPGATTIGVTTAPSNTSSYTTENEASFLCPYVKVLDLKFEYCSEKKYFICEAQNLTTSNTCPPGFDYYGKNCYRTITRSPANFEDATKFCFLQNSKLAILDTEDKEWEAEAAIIGQNGTFLVSAMRNGSTLKWTNEKDFSPAHFKFAESDGDCLAFSSDAESPLLFEWWHVNCTKPSSFVCESNQLPPKEVETTTDVQTTTALSPLSCPHGYNWKSHEESGYCFWETTYETERLNWFQARNFCKLYGGDLASYDNEEQESNGLGGARGHYRGLWIGLKRDENDVFHWIDGNVLNFTNWDINEPNLNSKSKLCVTHTSGTSKWELDYCGVRRWFICKAPKVRNPVMPDVPSEKKPRCDIKDSSSYHSQWFEYQDHCYLIQEPGKYTWDTARLFCQDNGAHMISIHSFEETNFILSAITGYPDGNFWIGLSAHGLESTFEWTDNSPLEFVYWSDTRGEVKDFNTCVTFNKRDGSWDVDHCNRLQGVICKRSLNSSYDFTSTEPTTVMPGNCDNGWYNLGNKCYKLFGELWSQRLTWAAAKTECETMGASLLSVHDKDEQEFLTDVVLEGHTNVWIGLRALEGGTIFHWSDDTRMDFTNWNANEPSGYNGVDVMGLNSIDLCVEMEYDTTFMGKWNVVVCNQKKAYMCQKLKDPTNVGPYIDPFTCPNITGWSKLGSSCYGFFEQYNMTWMDAQRECRKYSANLVTYRNAAVSVFIKRKLKLKDAHFWIGAREKMPDKYEYVTGQTLFYANWMVDQPQAASSFLDNCVAIKGDGDWLVKSCKEKHPFICNTVRESEPEPDVDRSHTCTNFSGDWNDFGGDYCYFVQTGFKMTWIEAMHYCFSHGGYLASFHSADEIERVRKNVFANNVHQVLHIGLGRKRDGTYSWVDKSPVDFVNWDDNEPDDPNSKQCVEMSMSSGKWNDINCDEGMYGYICSAPKLRISSQEASLTSENTDDTSEHDDIKKKLTVGGIFGIVLCVLVVLAIIGVTVYYLRPKKEVKPRLLEQDNL